ncbi:hypothetical protein Ddc_18162 [Ditylenchus destructor]|nr:hypothetical protein Ddc_18162 [Ditylenchus destructor]
MEATNLDWTPPSIGVRDTPNNPFFVDENSDKLSLKSDSSAHCRRTSPLILVFRHRQSTWVSALTYRDKQV